LEKEDWPWTPGQLDKLDEIFDKNESHSVDTKQRMLQSLQQAVQRNGRLQGRYAESFVIHICRALEKLLVFAQLFQAARACPARHNFICSNTKRCSLQKEIIIFADPLCTFYLLKSFWGDSVLKLPIDTQKNLLEIIETLQSSKVVFR
jgi:hypothetical protein